MSPQDVFNMMFEGMRLKRAESQMTLGELIFELKSMPEDAEVANLCNPHSYRGYYSDLAFERDKGTRKVSDLLADCELALGATFEGYKGGDFVMDESTPIWVAGYGCCGVKLLALVDNGEIETEEDD